MKKSTLANMIAYLNGDASVDTTALKGELTEEWERIAAKAEEKKSTREAVALVALRVLADSAEPLTVKELYAQLIMEEAFPEDYSERSLMWLVSHDSRFERHEDGRNPYKYSAK